MDRDKIRLDLSPYETIFVLRLMESALKDSTSRAYEKKTAQDIIYRMRDSVREYYRGKESENPQSV